MNQSTRYDDMALQDPSGVVEDLLPLVKSIALRIRVKLPDFIELDDLTQAGLIGLLNACQSYDPNQAPTSERMRRSASAARFLMNCDATIGYRDRCKHSLGRSRGRSPK